MNTTISHLRPETVTLIEKNARRLGISIDDYLRTLLPANEEIALNGDDDNFEKDMELLAERSEYTRHYEGTYTREDIYFDHD